MYLYFIFIQLHFNKEFCIPYVFPFVFASLLIGAGINKFKVFFFYRMCAHITNFLFSIILLTKLTLLKSVNEIVLFIQLFVLIIGLSFLVNLYLCYVHTFIRIIDY